MFSNLLVHQNSGRLFKREVTVKQIFKSEIMRTTHTLTPHDSRHLAFPCQHLFTLFYSQHLGEPSLFLVLLPLYLQSQAWSF